MKTKIESVDPCKIYVFYIFQKCVFWSGGHEWVAGEGGGGECDKVGCKQFLNKT